MNELLWIHRKGRVIRAAREEFHYSTTIECTPIPGTVNFTAPPASANSSFTGSSFCGVNSVTDLAGAGNWFFTVTENAPALPAIKVDEVGNHLLRPGTFLQFDSGRQRSLRRH